jgi:thiol-disulfide isomerase/thioredoxin
MKYSILLTGIVVSCCSILSTRIIHIEGQSNYASLAPQSVIMVTTPTCEPCQLVKPLYKQLSDTYSHVTFYITESDFIRTKFNIRGFPTFLFLQDGKEVDRFITGEQGFTQKFVKTLGNAFGSPTTKTKRKRRRTQRSCGQICTSN